MQHAFAAKTVCSALFALSLSATLRGAEAGKKAPAPVYSDSIAAVVNGEVITVFDIVRETAALEAQIQERTKDPQEARRKILELRRSAGERLVERELLYAEFQKLGATVPEEIVQERVNRIVQAKSMGNRTRFEEELRKQGMTMSEFEKKVAKDLAVELLVQEKVRRFVRVAPSAVAAYYRNHPDEFGVPGRVRLQMILLKKDGRYAGRLDAVDREIRRKAAAGTHFAELAKEYSEAPTASRGGDLGWVPDSQLRKDFREAIKGVPPGKLAKTVRSDDGRILLRVVEREATRVIPLTPELEQKIESRLRRQAEDRRYKEYVAELSRKYYVRKYF
ncbi:MAG: hypothetical protein GXP31_03300 [Kiritimatiellaeota bacterium]|nr:hypothetical protein [Kiritimatiellota bacterium]